jgi:hypothetical protein
MCTRRVWISMTQDVQALEENRVNVHEVACQDSLNVLQQHSIKGTDLCFRASPLVARMLGLPLAR